jgi:hypothetical protein
MTTTLRAPWPNYKVTSILPSPEFGDGRAAESTIVIKRTMTGRKLTYVKPSDRYLLTLPFQLTRMKALEVEAFLKSYQAAPIFLELYDGSQWEAKLVNQPVSRVATERIGTSTISGKELIELTLTFSAKRLN